MLRLQRYLETPAAIKQCPIVAGAARAHNTDLIPRTSDRKWAAEFCSWAKATTITLAALNTNNPQGITPSYIFSGCKVWKVFRNNLCLKSSFVRRELLRLPLTQPGLDKPPHWYNWGRRLFRLKSPKWQCWIEKQLPRAECKSATS